MDDADRGDEVYQPQQQSQAADPIEQLDTEDTLDDPDVDDVLDRGYSPPERPYAVDDVGTTAAEQHRGESLESRLARELPEDGAPPGTGWAMSWTGTVSRGTARSARSAPGG